MKFVTWFNKWFSMVHSHLEEAHPNLFPQSRKHQKCPKCLALGVPFTVTKGPSPSPENCLTP